MEAALAYTRELGWHLVPCRGLRIHFSRQKPRWRYSEDETARRMLDQGYSPEHVTRTIQKLRPVEETHA